MVRKPQYHRDSHFITVSKELVNNTGWKVSNEILFEPDGERVPLKKK